MVEKLSTASGRNPINGCNIKNYQRIVHSLNSWQQQHIANNTNLTSIDQDCTEELGSQDKLFDLVILEELEACQFNSDILED